MPLLASLLGVHDETCETFKRLSPTMTLSEFLGDPWYDVKYPTGPAVEIKQT